MRPVVLVPLHSNPSRSLPPHALESAGISRPPAASVIDGHSGSNAGEHQCTLMRAAKRRTGPLPEGYVRMNCGVLKTIEAARMVSWRGVADAPPEVYLEMRKLRQRELELEKQRREQAAITRNLELDKQKKEQHEVIVREQKQEQDKQKREEAATVAARQLHWQRMLHAPSETAHPMSAPAPKTWISSSSTSSSDSSTSSGPQPASTCSFKVSFRLLSAFDKSGQGLEKQKQEAVGEVVRQCHLQNVLQPPPQTPHLASVFTPTASTLSFSTSSPGSNSNLGSARASDPALESPPSSPRALSPGPVFMPAPAQDLASNPPPVSARTPTRDLDPLFARTPMPPPITTTRIIPLAAQSAEVDSADPDELPADESGSLDPLRDASNFTVDSIERLCSISSITDLVLRDSPVPTDNEPQGQHTTESIANYAFSSVRRQRSISSNINVILQESPTPAKNQSQDRQSPADVVGSTIDSARRRRSISSTICVMPRPSPAPAPARLQAPKKAPMKGVCFLSHLLLPVDTPRLIQDTETWTLR